MADNPATDQPAEPVVPHTRTAADSDGESQPRKRAAKSTKRTTRSKAGKQSTEGVTSPQAADEPAKKPRRKRAPRAAASAVTDEVVPESPAPPPSAPVIAEDSPAPADSPAADSLATPPDHEAVPAPPSGDGGDGKAPDPGEAPDRGTTTPGSGAAPRLGTAPGAWAAAAWDALRRFGQPPERLAELAVAELGPRAAAWVAWLRQTYPGAPAAGIARLAARQAARYGLALTALEVGGPVAAPAYLSASAWVRASLALRIAAAYGHDPTDPRRALELLELLQLADDPAEQAEDRERLSVAGEAEQPDGGRGRGLSLEQAFRRLNVGLYLFGLFRPRRGNPLNTAVRALLAASEQSDALDRLAHRAIARYRDSR